MLAVPDTMGTGRTDRSKGGAYGARMFEMYGPEETEFLSYVRTISLANDGGRWRFNQSGMPPHEEDTEWHAARSIENDSSWSTCRSDGEGRVASVG